VKNLELEGRHVASATRYMFSENLPLRARPGEPGRAPSTSQAIRPLPAEKKVARCRSPDLQDVSGRRLARRPAAARAVHRSQGARRIHRPRRRNRQAAAVQGSRPSRHQRHARTFNAEGAGMKYVTVLSGIGGSSGLETRARAVLQGARCGRGGSAVMDTLALECRN